MSTADGDHSFSRLPGVGEVLDERYRLDGLVASGGMGVVLRARQLSMERDVAVKLLHPHTASDPETIERFHREVDLAKNLQHPHTIQLYDFGRTDAGVLYIVMEYLEGRDLKELAQKEGPLTVGRTIELLRQGLDGLAEAHAADIVHRDLKPSNIFIERDRRGRDFVKLLDFGIARSLEQPSELTGTNQICGTAHYMAPEALLQRDTGKCGDVYAMGLIAIEVLSGKRLFDAETTPQTILLQLEHEVPIPAPLRGTALGDVLRSATAKHPDDRYGDAEEMLDALEDADIGEIPSTVRPGPDAIPPIEMTQDKEAYGRLADGLEAESVDALRRSGDTLVSSTPPTPTPAPTPGGSEADSGNDATKSDIRARNQEELVGGFAARLIEGSDAQLIWAVAGVGGIATAIAVFFYVFVPGNGFDVAASPPDARHHPPPRATSADAANSPTDESVAGRSVSDAGP